MRTSSLTRRAATGVAAVEIPAFKPKISLSSYFPAGTHYFYGYPLGTSSGFLNTLPPHGQELIAARTFCCAGPQILAISFPGTMPEKLPASIHSTFGLPRLREKQNVLLPEIDKALPEPERNERIKQALSTVVPAGTLVMAQPYIDEHMGATFQLPPQLSYMLNDKKHLGSYVDAQYLPKRYATYANGKEFTTAVEAHTVPLPCVVKASASSAGHGVFKCRTAAQLAAAVTSLKPLQGTIFIEQYIQARREFAVHFGIPASPKKPIDILGISEGLATPEGHFVGGIIERTPLTAGLEAVIDHLYKQALPQVRAMGWYGVGGLDILQDCNDNYYVIDCNFRMTAMTPYQLLSLNGTVPAPLLSFTGSFTGTAEDLLQKLEPLAGAQSAGRFIHLIALNKDENTWHLNGALIFNSRAELRTHLAVARQAGIVSPAFELAEAWETSHEQ